MIVKNKLDDANMTKNTNEDMNGEEKIERNETEKKQAGNFLQITYSQRTMELKINK